MTIRLARNVDRSAPSGSGSSEVGPTPALPKSTYHWMAFLASGVVKSVVVRSELYGLPPCWTIMLAIGAHSPHAHSTPNPYTWVLPPDFWVSCLAMLRSWS